MPINHLLVWIVCSSCLLLLVRILRSPRPYPWGWVGVILLILGVTGGLVLMGNAIAGWVGMAFWLGFMVFPSLGMAQVNRLTFQEHYQQASRLAHLISWLHPADGWPEHPHLLKALALGQQGHLDAARHIIQRYQQRSSPSAQTATALLYRMSAEWQDLLTWLETCYSETALLKRSPALTVHYIRALGETGQLNRLLQAVPRAETLFERTGDLTSLQLIRMFALAFSGQRTPVEHLFAGPLVHYAPSTREFWLATAEGAAGQRLLAQQRLHDLQTSQDVTLRQAVRWRLAHPLAHPDQVLTDDTRQILARISLDLQEEDRYNVRTNRHSGRQAPVTYGLIGLNLLLFGLSSWVGSAEDLETLYRLGALLPAAVWAGESWRLLAATFLHFGWLHLLMNMMGLYFLGLFVEARLGTWKYLVTYFTSGIGSMLVITLLALVRPTPAQIVVGASGAIMGLIGAMGAIFLYGWQRDKSRTAAKRLRAVLFIIGLQVVFDLTTPQISFVGHISGLILGFLVTCLVLLKHKFPEFPTRNSSQKC